MDDEMEVEMEVDAGVSQAESAEIKSPKRNVIRAESEETQDFVCEMLTISPEEAEELAFVPSGLCEPRGAIYFCDNRCSDKAVRYRQFASLVVEEGREARTVNSCQQCCYERRVQQGEPAELVAMESSRGKEDTASWETSNSHPAEVLAGLVEDNSRLQSKATVKYYETIFEEMRELKEKKSREALVRVQQKHIELK